MAEERSQNLNGQANNGQNYDIEIVNEKLPQDISRFKERRQFPRVNYSMSVQFKQISKTSGLFAGTLSEDLSGGGIRLLSDEFLPPRTKLLLDFSIGTTLTQIKTVAEIRWIMQKPLYDKYVAGLQFIEIPEDQKRQIIAFVRQNFS